MVAQELSMAIMLNDKLGHQKDRRKLQSLRTIDESLKELWGYEGKLNLGVKA